MAIRNTRLVTKNSDIINRPLPTTGLLAGEAIVNTADGIVWYSGVTTSTSGWTQSGPTTPTLFEVGSNLYDLKLRNQITEYEGVSGAGLVGKFLSGTTNGFVLSDIANIVSVDTYVTGFTYDNANNISLTQTVSGPSLSVNIDTMTGLTVTGAISASTIDTSILNATLISATTIDANNILSGGTDLATIIGNGDTFVTGGTVSVPATDNTNAATIGLLYKNNEGPHILPFEDTYTTGGTLSGSNLLLDRNDSTQLSISLSGLDTNDTFVTGFTYTPATNTFTVEQNEGESPISASFDTVSGLTVSNLTAGRVVYVGTSGLLTDEAGFTYDDTVNTLSTPSDGTVNVGTGGLNVDGDTVLQGSLTVFGPSVSAFTSQLYVEDPNITLNYNPTGNTIATSVGAGWTIQDGNGIVSGDVNLDIRRMDTLTGLTATDIPDVTEYVASTGYENRGWVTQLNDIVIRSSNITTPNGVRVLAEFDVLDGGTF